MPNLKSLLCSVWAVKGGYEKVNEHLLNGRNLYLFYPKQQRLSVGYWLGLCLGMAVGLGHSKHVLLCHPKVEKDLILLKATLDVLVKKIQ